MRRNVRRLNREIGNHSANLPVAAQISLPLSLPTSYQPRAEEKHIVNNLLNTHDGDDYQDNDEDGGNNSSGMISSHPVGQGSSPLNLSSFEHQPQQQYRSASKQLQNNSGKKKVRKAVNLSGKFNSAFFLLIFLIFPSF